MVQGIWVNGAQIGNGTTTGPGAQRGTYVGTTRSDGSGTLNWIFGTGAANGGAAFHWIWNAYNRCLVSGMVRDTTDQWTYQSTTVRAANNSAAICVQYVVGLDIEPVRAHYHSVATAGSSSNAFVGIGVDTTTVKSGIFGPAAFGTSVTAYGSAVYNANPGIGAHFLSAVESCNTATTAVTFYGDSGGTIFQTGLEYQIWA